MTAWDMRRASLRDRAGLEALCRAAVGPDDYVLEMLDDMILRRVAYVALEGDRIVGAMAYADMPDGSAWLSAARTHPDYRRKGVASALIGVLEGLARRSGRTAIRLCAETSNAAGIASFERAGMRAVARFARRVAAVPRRGRAGVRPDAVLLTDALWTRIEASPILEAGRGFVAFEDGFVRLDRATGHRLANVGAMRSIDGHLALLEPPGGGSVGEVHVSPVAGDVRSILEGTLGIARSRAADRTETFLPLAEGILDAASAAGFRPGEWGAEVVLAERALGGAPMASRRRRTMAEIQAAKRTGYGALALLAPAGHGHGPHEDRWNP